MTTFKITPTNAVTDRDAEEAVEPEPGARWTGPPTTETFDVYGKDGELVSLTVGEAYTTDDAEQAAVVAANADNRNALPEVVTEYDETAAPAPKSASTKTAK